MYNVSDVRYFYVRHLSGRVITVARMVDKANQKVRFAFAINAINKGDHFSKSRGRDIARARLLSDKYYEVDMIDLRPIDTIKNAMMNKELFTTSVRKMIRTYS